MSAIPFVTLDDPRYGEVVQVAPLVRRVIATNPSKFTYHGTGTYLIGTRTLAVVDPGPPVEGHLDALLAALDRLGVDTSDAEPLVTQFVLGHGHPVGTVRAIG